MQQATFTSWCGGTEGEDCKIYDIIWHVIENFEEVNFPTVFCSALGIAAALLTSSSALHVPALGWRGARFSPSWHSSTRRWRGNGFSSS